jgi:hypothetical protein
MKRKGLPNERDGTSVQCGSIRTRVEPCGKSLREVPAKRHRSNDTVFRAGSNPHIIAHSCRPTGAFARSAKRFELRVRSLPWKGI